MNHSVSSIENPILIKTVRKTVARLLTAKTVMKNQIIAKKYEK
jgi:ribosomal protein L29